MEKYSVIGKRLPRLDSVAKVTGDAKYAGDFFLPGMLHGKILRSTVPHAKILNIDTSRAEKLPGVRAVATGKDISDIPHGFIRAAPAPFFLRDKFSLAKEKVRFIGDEIAAVAAVDEDTAMEALDLIKVDYEELPAYFSPQESMALDAVRIHDHAESNVSVVISFHLGNIEQGFAESDFVFEDNYSTQYILASYIEPHAAVADFSQSGNVTLWLSTQTPFYDRTNIAETLGIPESKVRVIKPPVGGGFGAKTETHTLFTASAVLSRKAGRPVKIIYSREEEFTSTAHRHGVTVNHKIGVKKDGTIKAVDSKFFADGGAYNSHSAISMFIMGTLQNGPYNMGSFKYEGIRVYTNKPFAGGVRGHGAIQPRFVIETMMDSISEKLDIDPIEIRKMNAVKAGQTTISKFKIRSCGHTEALDKAVEEIGWKDKWRKLPDGKGVGLASMFFASGAAFSFFYDNPPSFSGVKINAETDGNFTLFTGTSDIGQGSETTLAQIAAEELGVGLNKISVIASDTATTPLDMGSYSSRVTVFGGGAAKIAAYNMKMKLFDIAADMLEANKDDLEAKNERIYVKGTPEKSVSIADTVIGYYNKMKEHLTSSGDYNPPADVGGEMRLDLGEVNISPTFSFGTHATEVDVDKETGEVKVQKIAAAHDCGFAINPMAVEGQIEGSIQMTFGQALLEDYRMEKGWSITNSFIDYKMATSEDMPYIKPIIVESIDSEGPFGAKEASEGTNVATIPSIANAIYDAVGIRMKDLPITPEKILRALEKKEGGK
ncbi:MAG: molybdopterin-dependent oxidoreductase [Desulfobacterium sp.]|nr:molybdopterin-dependent oxidoreductase [Desulfobacterium sp.]MBU3948284.1 xanthine dehydrogenase family protein molybdopterin-binding subunit [Pseudomonadota bacterium]MBU4036480.1 xanthine dehydrogenase family protein molybdopterin-binding subunit [Pseudomonadota bacterium]